MKITTHSDRMIIEETIQCLPIDTCPDTPRRASRAIIICFPIQIPVIAIISLGAMIETIGIMRDFKIDFPMVKEPPQPVTVRGIIIGVKGMAHEPIGEPVHPDGSRGFIPMGASEKEYLGFMEPQAFIGDTDVVGIVPPRNVSCTVELICLKDFYEDGVEESKDKINRGDSTTTIVIPSLSRDLVVNPLRILFPDFSVRKF